MRGEKRTLPRIVARRLTTFDALAGVESPLLRRLYAGRGVASLDQLDYRLASLPHFRDFKGIDKAIELLCDAIERGARIQVVGDFDADGATSTALICDALLAMGAARVDHFVPHRVAHGYGLSPAVVAALGEAASGDLIVTVDNGISSIAGVRAAQTAGWRVLVCDHHLPGERVPEAEAIVNPNQPGCAHPGKALAGVGVVFFLMVALRAALAAQPGDRVLPRMSDYLDLVAVGTVADVVRLDHPNRTLVAQGLRRIRHGLARPGIAALIEAAGRQAYRLDTADIGFAIAPRLNAAGRLEDMRIGVECLRATNSDVARARAATLSALNRERRGVQQRMQTDAEAALAQVDTSPDDPPPAITVHRPDWHEGVVGLVASRLREAYRRPVAAFALGAHGLLKGSCRSIEGLHIRDVLAAVDAHDPDLIAQFGGHAQAAGLSLAPERLAAFENAFAEAVAQRLTDDMLSPDIVTDGELAPDELTLGTAQQLRAAGPWGAGFEEPLFEGRFTILDQRIVGERHLKMQVRADGGAPIEAMRFGHDTLLDADRRYRFVYRLAVNVFRDRTSANLIVVEHRVDGD